MSRNTSIDDPNFSHSKNEIEDFRSWAIKHREKLKNLMLLSFTIATAVILSAILVATVLVFPAVFTTLMAVSIIGSTIVTIIGFSGAIDEYPGYKGSRSPEHMGDPGNNELKDWKAQNESQGADKTRLIMAGWAALGFFLTIIGIAVPVVPVAILIVGIVIAGTAAVGFGTSVLTDRFLPRKVVQSDDIELTDFSSSTRKLSEEPVPSEASQPLDISIIKSGQREQTPVVLSSNHYAIHGSPDLPVHSTPGLDKSNSPELR